MESLRHIFHLQTRHDVHGHQLLEEEFTGIRNLDSGDIRPRLAVRTVLVPASNESTSRADIEVIVVRGKEESLNKEGRGSMGNHTVALHFTDSETSIP